MAQIGHPHDAVGGLEPLEGVGYVRYSGSSSVPRPDGGMVVWSGFPFGTPITHAAPQDIATES